MADTWLEFFKGQIKTGTGTGNGASQTIAHGLTGTPNFVSVVPTASGTSVTGLYADSTNVYLTVTNGKGYGYVIMVV